MTITKGGTYSGRWKSLNPDIPAIRIRTDEPVVITKSYLRSRGHLITGEVDDVDLTVTDSFGEALNPSRKGRVPGRFVKLYNADSVKVEHNFLKGTAGIRLEGYSGNRQTDTFTVKYNRVMNIDGRRSTGSRFSDDDSTSDLVQFVQLVEAHQVPGVQISRNDVLNQPGRSRVEDVISMYLSSGTENSPISIRGNFINGAYPASPASSPYSGGGIMLGDGTDRRVNAGNVQARRNVVANTVNYGIGVSAGESMLISENRVLATGRLHNGRTAAAQNVGIYVWNLHGKSDFGDISVIDNVSGWERPRKNGRNDFWLPDADTVRGNSSYACSVTSAAIRAEYAAWLHQVDKAGLTIGPRK